MIKIATAAACTVFLSACSNLPEWAATSPFLKGGASGADVSEYNFDWRLSGDRHVAPLQIFDDGKRTWLQLLPDQIAPAVFHRTAHGDRLLPFVRQGEYLLIDGVWPVLTFRGGGLGAAAHKALPEVTPLGIPADKISADRALDTTQHSDDSTLSVPQPGLPKTGDYDVAAIDTGGDSDEARRLTDATFDSISPPSYAVLLQDGNLRRVLHRWAARANWTFAPEHWAVDVDIPISGEADFPGSFEDAVQDVLASTELADRPLRPCFYSNRVLRVVAYTQSCDRSGATTS